MRPDRRPTVRRRYTSEAGFTADFLRVHDFLLTQNHSRLLSPTYPWGRWEWAFCRSHQDTAALDRIGIWEADGGAAGGSEIVALATYEDRLGEAFLVVRPGFERLKPDLVDHAVAQLGVGGSVRLMVDDHDGELQAVARSRGLRPTEQAQPTAVLEADSPRTWTLPDGFRLARLADELDVRRLHRCLHRGFDNAGEVDDSDAALQARVREITGPHQDLSLHHVVVAPGGDYASYCGMWYSPGEYAALVEPVCTDPDYRRLGLGRAAVLASVRACFAAGARAAIVGSEQQFYYDIGFAPRFGCHAWTGPSPRTVVPRA